MRARIGGIARVIVFCCCVPCALCHAGTRPRFRGPLTIANIPRSLVTVHEGDLDGDGKLDLIASSGTGTVTVLFQDPEDRQVWEPVPVRVGSSVFFTRAGDFDGDGLDDLAAADGASTAFYVRSLGNRTFDRPIALPQARGARWIATGDWNNDGHLDLASSNLNTSTLTIFLGDGAGGFLLTQNPASGREHTLEALDYDGDGILDLALGTGLPGIQLHKGLGDGKFQQRGNVSNLGCVEYISTGDLNGDGMGDLAPTCIDDGTAYVGLSNGNGAYRQVLRAPFASGTESSAMADLNGDGNDDVALVSAGSGLLRVYPGKGDGTFEAPVDFGATGSTPVFLIAADLDRDGHNDVVSADQGSSTLTVFYGREGERFFESSDSISGFGTAKGGALADFDRDGVPDIMLVSATLAKAYVYLHLAGELATTPSISIDLAARYSSLAVADLNADGIPDLAGTNLTGDLFQAAILDAEGKAVQEVSLASGDLPQEAVPGRIDGDQSVDMAVPCSTSSDISLFWGQGDGTFSEAQSLPSIIRPKKARLGDLNGDGRTDILVFTTKLVSIHYNLGSREFSEPVTLAEEVGKTYLDAVILDLDRDQRADLVVGESRGQGALVYFGSGSGALEEAVAFPLGLPPATLRGIDVDRDGRLDLTASSTGGQGVSIAYGLRARAFDPPVVYRVGISASSHAIEDINDDGIFDIVAFGTTGVTIRLGELTGPPGGPRFYRGDADGNGALSITDPVATLNWLFNDGPAPTCPDAADSDDSGLINLTDPIGVLNWLFNDGPAPADPGPRDCGEDPTPEDTLGECEASC